MARKKRKIRGHRKKMRTFEGARKDSIMGTMASIEGLLFQIEKLQTPGYKYWKDKTYKNPSDF